MGRAHLAALAGVVAIMCGATYGADAGLPSGVKAVWDMDKASRVTTPTHEWICVNGLWRWQPAGNEPGNSPSGDWGFFKVPGSWPGITDYMQNDCQGVILPAGTGRRVLGGMTAAWYQRDITVPKEWAGRRVALSAEYVNSRATVYLDGKEAGVIMFPSGEADISGLARPGTKQSLTILLEAKPLQEYTLAHNDTNSSRRVKGSVARRGLCGDVYLVSSPRGARISDVKIDTSFRKGQATISAAVDHLAGGASYFLRAEISDGGKTVATLKSASFTSANVAEGRYAFTADWNPPKLWDINTPKNMYQAQVTLVDAGNRNVDVFRPERFGFREFWIDGKDFYLNGTRIYLSAVPLDNAQLGAYASTYEAACESMRRLKSFGINYVYTHNYDCEPGSHISFAEILRAADDTGMLVGMSQPHCSNYDWRGGDNGYARHAEFYVRAAQNHPAVVFYVTSHNATGYWDGMNPDKIDDKPVTRSSWSQNNVNNALKAEAIIRRLDPTRIIYHHSSGNLSGMYTLNFYTNWAPIQEMDDWFEHWSTTAKIPLFTCEYAVPCLWDWSMYRGWYEGKRNFGSASVPWEICIAEWNAQFYGDAAYKISEAEKKDLKWEAPKFNAHQTWKRWDYPEDLNSREFEERMPVEAAYITSNWRAFRTWGVSAVNCWECGEFWKPNEGVDKGRKDLPVDWDKLQRPGFSPDYIDKQYERMDLSYDSKDWTPTVAAKELYRNNMPLLAYIGGKSAAFTSKDHNFLPGQTVEKQAIVINNSRETVLAEVSWSLELPETMAGSKKVTVKTGDKECVPMQFALPADLAPGAYKLTLNVAFDKGSGQTDTFMVDVMAPAAKPAVKSKIALFDPKGETGRILQEMGIAFENATGAIPANCDVLIIGKQALTASGPGPDVSRVKDGLKVVMFEQTSDVLQNRFGFRVADYGLRWVFKRVPDHPLLAGITDANLANWAGQATLLPARLTFTDKTDYDERVRWCDIPVTRVWRCGNRGDVASVLIEKPACGDFLPIVDGGFSLQYSPLMEYRQGKGMVIICQMDVTGRSEVDPAARALVSNIIKYASTWEPSPARKAVYVGDPAGKSFLEAAGMTLGAYAGGKPAPDQVLIVGPDGGPRLGANAAAIGEWLKGGGNLLALGLDEKNVNAFLPTKVTMTRGEHIAAYFAPMGAGSLLAGVGPADVHSREPRQIPLVTGGADAVGDGVLATMPGTHVVICQMAPWQYNAEQQNTKRTFRHVFFLTSRIMANMGVSGQTPLLERFRAPLVEKNDKRWLTGFYMDTPQEWDDPYRFFGW